MDVLPKALPEEFFLEASDDSLSLLAQLMDIGMAMCIQGYMNSQDARQDVCNVIQQHLGEAIKQATFYQELHDSGIVATMRNLNLDAIAAMTNIEQMESLANTIRYIKDNAKYIRATNRPREREVYKAFVSSIPSDYRPGVQANRDYFYDPNGREVYTGLGSIVRKQQEIDIAYKGLQYRIAMYRTVANPAPYFTRI